MFEYPKIHEIRSASDMVHPASTPENPIIAAYVLVIRDRSPKGYIDDEFLNWNYILWWRRNHALNRELCLALRAETLVPDGEPQANDKFLEFRKDKLRFGYGKVYICEARIEKRQRDSRRRHKRSNSCCANGKTRRSGRRASEKPLRASLSGEGFNLWITKSRKTLIEY